MFKICWLRNVATIWVVNKINLDKCIIDKRGCNLFLRFPNSFNNHPISLVYIIKLSFQFFFLQLLYYSSREWFWFAFLFCLHKPTIIQNSTGMCIILVWFDFNPFISLFVVVVVVGKYKNYNKKKTLTKTKMWHASI